MLTSGTEVAGKSKPEPFGFRRLADETALQRSGSGRISHRLRECRRGLDLADQPSKCDRYDCAQYGKANPES